MRCSIMEYVRKRRLYKAVEIEDERVMLIKLAERLHNMRTIEFMDEDRARIKAKETFDLFLPMARKLKNETLISELNDLTVK